MRPLSPRREIGFLISDVARLLSSCSRMSCMVCALCDVSGIAQWLLLRWPVRRGSTKGFALRLRQRRRRQPHRR